MYNGSFFYTNYNGLMGGAFLNANYFTITLKTILRRYPNESCLPALTTFIHRVRENTYQLILGVFSVLSVKQFVSTRRPCNAINLLFYSFPSLHYHPNRQEREPNPSRLSNREEEIPRLAMPKGTRAKLLVQLNSLCDTRDRLSGFVARQQTKKGK